MKNLLCNISFVMNHENEIESCSHYRLKRGSFISVSEQERDHRQLFMEGVILKREVLRHRLTGDQKQEVDDTAIDQLLFADLLSQQNCDTEQNFCEMTDMVNRISSFL